MKIHRLELSAFGPFADSIAVDMDRLGSDGLFLLHGETGSGKTTLLDAVAFALYGTVPGARGEVKRLRCDRSDPSTPTTVTLDATIAGRRLVLTRSPAYERPKQRGSGTTTQQASVTLRWVDQAGQLDRAGQSHRAGQGDTDLTSSVDHAHLTRAEDVGGAVLGLLGMSADQFFQVVLLPQGEFARFLRASTSERQQLLEKLFDTVRFARLEDAFAGRRRAASVHLAEADTVVAQRLARVLQAVDEKEPPSDPKLPWLADLGATAAAAAGSMRSRAITARRARKTADNALEAAEKCAADAKKLTTLRAHQSELDDRSEAMAALEGQILAAERAGEIGGLHRAVLEVHNAVAAAIAETTDAKALVPADYLAEAARRSPELVAHADVEERHVAPLEDPAVVRAIADIAREKAGSIGALVAEEAAQELDRRDASALAQQRTTDEAELRRVETDLTALPGRLTAVRSEIAELQQHAARRPSCDAAVASAEEIYAAASQVPTLQSLVNVAHRACAQAVDDHQRAREVRLDLVERRIAGMAAELARDLSDGAPCAVCGSTNHPSPARSDIDLVGAADLDAAQELESTTEATRTRATTDHADAQRAVSMAEAAARGYQAPTAASLLDEAKTKRHSAAQAEQRLPEVEASAERLSQQQTELAETRLTLLKRIEASRGEEVARRRAIDDRAVKLASASSGYESVAAHRDHLLETATHLDGWAEAIADALRAQRGFAEASQARADGVLKAGFAELAEALAAAAFDAHAARESIADYRQQRAIVAQALADLEVPTMGDPDLDDETRSIELESVRAAAAAAVEADESAAANVTLSEQREHDVAATAAALKQAWSQREPIAERCAEATALAELVLGRGQNARSLSLRSYVLALKLQQVADIASTRLQAMSSGRYRFVHTDARESHGRSGGLGLEIFDAHSGVARSTKTLSGGESFLASLSLALGLADVVAAESGGRMLDTIFIDEGFGSLDSDTLEMVMATLDDLRAGGRVVGVVSHVDEMRQRIPSRLHVHKGVAGSTVELLAS